MKTFEELNLLETKFHKLEVRELIKCAVKSAELSKKTIKCPQWVSNIGMEWLSRLLTEPRRLWKRYIIDNRLFFYRLLREQFLKKLR